MRESGLYQKAGIGKARCLICQRKCLISEGGVGFCLSKKNIKGKIFDLLDGVITGYQLDPVEKKPFYHFLPGEKTLSIGSYGCNYRCKQCLNFSHSWGENAMETLRLLEKGKDQFLRVAPEAVVEEALKRKIKIIAFTYNEPVIWSNFVYQVARLAKKKKLYTLLVTNGSWSRETIDRLAPVIDGANIDLKGFSQKTYLKMGAFWGQVLEMIEYAFKKKIFIEITTLLIPTINDQEKELKAMTQWIAKKLDPQIPWHLSQYDPYLAPEREFQKLPLTPVEGLKTAAEIGRKQGLNHVYVWAPGDYYSQGNTFCPKCQSLLIKRAGWRPEIINLDFKKSACRKCGFKILGLWE